MGVATAHTWPHLTRVYMYMVHGSPSAVTALLGAQTFLLLLLLLWCLELRLHSLQVDR
jgi:hypothetical protein